MRRLLPLLVLAVALVTAGCGLDDGAASDATGGDPAAGGISQADDDLQLEVDLGEGRAPVTWTLSCLGPAEGSHPQAQAACDHLAGLERPFAPLPEDVVCSQQYGGPQTARVLGRWDGEPVDLHLSRIDGCRIAQWDSLVPVVPAPAG
ncbi:hypothetical protein DQ239_05265 [Blastococcus sp. TF02-09]|uniref:SSI family serine proteinase inhibitor n=1 Tax=Blastococcus sp. TF02-09 TaxID=2250576 RepID=UPI000DEB3E00|nr:SSI family serine proteinase inhibitor [Blastococcus sp. TF02-9]RBY79078.1 hypothetical protein DQ239_05265 [Blastococcus sp. TF02-9]